MRCAFCVLFWIVSDAQRSASLRLCIATAATDVAAARTRTLSHPRKTRSKRAQSRLTVGHPLRIPPIYHHHVHLRKCRSQDIPLSTVLCTLRAPHSDLEAYRHQDQYHDFGSLRSVPATPNGSVHAHFPLITATRLTSIPRRIAARHRARSATQRNAPPSTLTAAHFRIHVCSGFVARSTPDACVICPLLPHLYCRILDISAISRAAVALCRGDPAGERTRIAVTGQGLSPASASHREDPGICCRCGGIASGTFAIQ